MTGYRNFGPPGSQRSHAIMAADLPYLFQSRCHVD